MKRVNGEGIISKRSSDGRWIGQITIGYDESGKAIRKACSAKSQAECKRKLDKLKNQFASIQGKTIATLKSLTSIICSPIGLTKSVMSKSSKNLLFKLISAGLIATS